MKNATLSCKMNLNNITNLLYSKGFECYLSTKSLKHDDCMIHHDIYTCTEGIFAGEVVDVHYNYNTGLIHDLSFSSQFHTQDGGSYETLPKIIKYL
jgi:hypothetical protein